MLSLKEFVRKLNPLEFGSVKREYEVTRILKKAESRKRPIVFHVENTAVDSVGAVLTDRRQIYSLLEVNNDRDAYSKLIKSLEGEHKVTINDMPESAKEVNVDLNMLPAVKFYERDGGLYFTSSLVVACLDGICNASIHRIMVRDKESAVIRLVPRHLWRMYNESLKRGRRLPISIVFGVHPIFLLAAATSPSYGVFELSLPSRILGRKIPLVRSPLHGNPIPWPFSILLEAEITEKQAPEGPFVDVTRTYDKIREQPIIKVSKMFLNEEEPFHIILPGGVEHMFLMGFPREALIWSHVSKVVPKVHKVRLTSGGGGWLHAVISIEKNHDGDAKNAILAAFAAHPSLKHVIVVDNDINIDDPEEVEWAMATRFQGDRDLIVIKNARGSTLDPSSSNGMTTKLGFDATAPLSERNRFLRATIPEGGDDNVY